VVRSLLFRLPGGEFVMALVAGPAQVDWRALRRYLGESRLTTASQEEMLALTGVTRPHFGRAPLRPVAEAICGCSALGTEAVVIQNRID
jgi:prolyl-tRNA editing enzyme YbaK/EbsC (Cys-tRNA(Pro) deacylase)